MLILGGQRLTVPLVDNFIADLKDAVAEAKAAPIGTGTMVSVYGALSLCLDLPCSLYLVGANRVERTESICNLLKEEQCISVHIRT